MPTELVCLNERVFVGNSEIVWDEAQFLDYIKDPKTKIPRTIMVFAGIKDEADAKNLWAYLKQFDTEGKKK